MTRSKIKTAIFSLLVFFLLATLGVTLSGPVFYEKRTLPENAVKTTQNTFSTTTMNTGMRKKLSTAKIAA